LNLNFKEKTTHARCLCLRNVYATPISTSKRIVVVQKTAATPRNLKLRLPTHNNKGTSTTTFSPSSPSSSSISSSSSSSSSPSSSSSSSSPSFFSSSPYEQNCHKTGIIGDDSVGGDGAMSPQPKILWIGASVPQTVCPTVLHIR